VSLCKGDLILVVECLVERRPDLIGEIDAKFLCEISNPNFKLFHTLTNQSCVNLYCADSIPTVHRICRWHNAAIVNTVLDKIWVDMMSIDRIY
jgi:hypothetical protein